jgi:hypothetical protein
VRHAREETAEIGRLSNRPDKAKLLINQANSGNYTNGGKFRQRLAIGGNSRREMAASTCRR